MKRLHYRIKRIGTMDDVDLHLKRHKKKWLIDLVGADTLDMPSGVTRMIGWKLLAYAHEADVRNGKPVENELDPRSLEVRKSTIREAAAFIEDHAAKLMLRNERGIAAELAWAAGELRKKLEE